MSYVPPMAVSGNGKIGAGNRRRPPSFRRSALDGLHMEGDWAARAVSNLWLHGCSRSLREYEVVGLDEVRRRKRQPGTPSGRLCHTSLQK